MTGFFMFIHAVVCAGMVFFILMQSGRGGGLTEGFASAESMFGAKTSAFLIKGTTILAISFLVTSLFLAVMSARRNESLMAGKIASPSEATTDAQTQAENVVQETVDKAAAGAQNVAQEAQKAAETAQPPVAQ